MTPADKRQQRIESKARSLDSELLAPANALGLLLPLEAWVSTTSPVLCARGGVPTFHARARDNSARGILLARHKFTSRSAERDSGGTLVRRRCCVSPMRPVGDTANTDASFRVVATAEDLWRYPLLRCFTATSPVSTSSSRMRRGPRSPHAAMAMHRLTRAPRPMLFSSRHRLRTCVTNLIVDICLWKCRRKVAAQRVLGRGSARSAALLARACAKRAFGSRAVSRNTIARSKRAEAM